MHITTQKTRGAGRMTSVILATAMVLTANAAVAGKKHLRCPKAEYLAGDFHQHTLYTDGSDPFTEVMASNYVHDLDWWANSEHGGRRNRDGDGNSWLDTEFYPENPILGDNLESGYMYRWQSLRDYVYPDILEARDHYPDATIISGFEWNVPGHEHCSTSFYSYDGSADHISEFEFRFDRSDPDTSRVGEPSLVDGWGPLSKNNDGKEDAIMAVTWAQDGYEQGLFDAWIVPAHIERAKSYGITDFRNWHNAGPDVMLGYEGAPGHQASGDRGFSRDAFGGGTYGGSGYFSAEVGGLWDALLGEGRIFTNFASSDYHNHWSNGGSDFHPGEYQKNYTYINRGQRDRIQAVFDGLRSGNSYHVEGDLIDELTFTATSRFKSATMGETLEVRRGDWVTIKVKARDPWGPNNCPLDIMNPSLAQVGIAQPLHLPVLDHIDIISGQVAGLVDPTDEAAYNDDTNPTARVISTVYKHARQNTLVAVYRFRATADSYFRARGTNLPADTPFETDCEGNPLADAEASDNIYSGPVEEGKGLSEEALAEKLFPWVEIDTTGKLDEVAEAYADLWFYTNAIFIDVK